MISANILVQLREADPVLWEKYENSIAAIYYDCEGDERELCASELCDNVQIAWLQHCLQERIRELRWRYYLSSATGQITCLIGISGNRQKIVVAETEAEALLRAYLAAKEASR